MTKCWLCGEEQWSSPSGTKYFELRWVKLPLRSCQEEFKTNYCDKFYEGHPRCTEQKDAEC